MIYNLLKKKLLPENYSTRTSSRLRPSVPYLKLTIVFLQACQLYLLKIKEDNILYRSTRNTTV